MARYFIQFVRNKECPYVFDWRTNSILRALWWLLVCCIKYPMVTFEVRRGEVSCDKCTADWCGKSPQFIWRTTDEKKGVDEGGADV